MGNFKFNSKICTTIEQSERLLALGLKKETADMIYVEVHCTDGSVQWDASPIMEGLTALDFEDNWPPAWSLDRLRELIPENIFTGVRNQWHRVMYNGVLTYEEGDDSLVSFREANIYDRCVFLHQMANQGRTFPKGVFGMK